MESNSSVSLLTIAEYVYGVRRPGWSDVDDGVLFLGLAEPELCIRALPRGSGRREGAGYLTALYFNEMSASYTMEVE